MPGRLLSQPARSTEPSRRSAIMTVSTLSAMISRLTREKCIPSWPIEMPSLTEMVPNSSGYPPPACTPSLLACASRSSERLQGVISFQELAIPICGLSQSSSVMPTARSMPRAAARSRPSVTSRLRGLMSGPERRVSELPGLPEFWLVVTRASLGRARDRDAGLGRRRASGLPDRSVRRFPPDVGRVLPRHEQDRDHAPAAVQERDRPLARQDVTGRGRHPASATNRPYPSGSTRARATVGDPAGAAWSSAKAAPGACTVTGRSFPWEPGTGSAGARKGVLVPAPRGTGQHCRAVS